MAGRAYQRVDLIEEPDQARGLHRWWIPVTDGVERLGVLRADTAEAGEAARDALRAVASMVALLLLSKRSFSDSHARLVRSAPMTVAAEMQ
ncbi:hypothetical protein [Streptomyces sp. H62]